MHIKHVMQSKGQLKVNDISTKRD